MITCDLFVIGAGSGGVRAARLAAAAGAKVVIAEESRVGGTCVIRGCVPKKLLSYAAHFAEDFEDAAGFGWQVGARRFSWPDLIARKDQEIDRLNNIYKKLLMDAQVELIAARAYVNADGHVQADGQIYAPGHILIATGARPAGLDIPGMAYAVTSDDVFHWDQLPPRIAIIGGGYIALEFASIFNGLGAEVTVLYRGEQVLRGFDRDVRDVVAQEMRKKGVRIECHKDVAAITKDTLGLHLALRQGGTIQADAVMLATGRVPYVANLGLESAGVTLNKAGAIDVDMYSRTSRDHIYAIGDCTNRLNLTPAAIREAVCFVETVFHHRPTAMDYEQTASAVFTHPPIGIIGMGEEQARLHHRVTIYRTMFRPMKHTLSGRDEKTMMKLVVDQASDRILGAHMVGVDAPEIIQTLAVAVKMGARKADLDRTLAIHPTAAEEFVTMRQAVT